MTPISSNTASITTSAEAPPELGGAGDQTHPGDPSAPSPPAGDCRAVICGDSVEPFLQEVAAGLDDGDRDAGIGETHRDAAAHRAGADDHARCDRARLCRFRHIGHLRRLALGEEDVALCFRLVAGDQLSEELAFALQPFLEAYDDRVAQGLDAGRGRVSASQPPGQRLGGIGKALADEFVFAVADEL